MKNLTAIMLAVAMVMGFFSTALAAGSTSTSNRPFVISGWFPTDASSADLILPDEDGESRLYIKIEVPFLNMTNAASVSFICHDSEDPAGFLSNLTDHIKINISSKCVFLHYGRLYPDGRVEVYYEGQYLFRMEK